MTPPPAYWYEPTLTCGRTINQRLLEERCSIEHSVQTKCLDDVGCLASCQQDLLKNILSAVQGGCGRAGYGRREGRQHHAPTCCRGQAHTLLGEGSGLGEVLNCQAGN